ncbi:MAG: aldo/keto reductase [Pseudomonadota bacterium]
MLTSDHKLSFGCSGLAGLYKPVSQAEAAEVLSEAWNAGIRYFDTAPHYGNGQSERRVGDFLRERDNWVLSTKVGRVLSPSKSSQAEVNGFHDPLPFTQHFDYTYDGIMRSVEASFHRLGLNKIDILYVHDIGDPAVGTDTPSHQKDLLDSGARALADLKAEGSVSSVGLGVNTIKICEDLIGRMEIDLILLAGRYTLLDQSAESRLFPLCDKHLIRLVIGGVFNSGILATGAVEGAFFDYAPASQEVLQRVRRLQAICDGHSVPLATAALQFPSSKPCVASTLIGTSKVSSLKRNISAWSSEIPEALWRDVRSEGLIPKSPSGPDAIAAQDRTIT